MFRIFPSYERLSTKQPLVCIHCSKDSLSAIPMTLTMHNAHSLLKSETSVFTCFHCGYRRTIYLHSSFSGRHELRLKEKAYDYKENFKKPAIHDHVIKQFLKK